MRSGRFAYAAFLALGVLDAVGYGMIGPIVPAISAATGAGPAAAGALVAAFGVGMVIGFYPAGYGVRRFGAATVLAVSLVVVALGAALFLLPASLPAYFAARFLMGLGSGGLWIGISLGVVERWPGGEYRRLAGVMAVYSAGAIGGPALAAIGGIHEPFAVYLGFVALGGSALLLIGAPHRHAPAFMSDRTVLRTPGFAVSAAAISLVSVTIGTLDGVLPLHFDDRLGQTGIAALYAGAGVVIAIFSIVGARLAMVRAVVAGTVLQVVGIALAGATGQVWWWVLSLGLAAIGFGLDQTGSLGYLLDAVGPDRMILAMVVWSQLFAIGYLIGPALGGIVAATLGYSAIGLVPLAFGILVFVALARMPARVEPVTPPA